MRTRPAVTAVAATSGTWLRPSASEAAAAEVVVFDGGGRRPMRSQPLPAKLLAMGCSCQPSRLHPATTAGAAEVEVVARAAELTVAAVVKIILHYITLVYIVLYYITSYEYRYITHI